MLPPRYFFGGVATMVALHYLAPGPRWLAGPWRYAGLLPIVLGVVAAVRVAGLFRRHDTTIRPFQESTALVTEGLFRYSRNPIYAAMLLTLGGLGLLLGSLSPLAVLPVLFWILTARFIRVEEAMLERTFGQQFVDYKRSVRRWLGRRGPV